jgi:hypothetical protein
LKFILIILDGFGLREDKNGNAYALGNTPNLDNLLQNKPLSVVETSGVHVGLPDGIMGNSEVGHTNIGAGRIVKQDLVRINDDKNLGDYEQTVPKLYSNVGYLDLYIMASYGDNRGQLQIFNKYDTCCFPGEFYKTYETEVKEVLSKLNSNNFDIFRTNLIN